MLKGSSHKAHFVLFLTLIAIKYEILEIFLFWRHLARFIDTQLFPLRS